MMETLPAPSATSSPSERIGNMKNYTDTYFLNKRFNWVVKKTGPYLVNRWKWEEKLMDAKTNEVLAQYVDFSTGNGLIGGEMPLSFWLQSDHCNSGDLNYGHFLEFKDKFLEGGK